MKLTFDKNLKLIYRQIQVQTVLIHFMVHLEFKRFVSFLIVSWHGPIFLPQIVLTKA